MKPDVDWQLYMVVDEAFVRPDRSLEQIARAAAAGGATVLQLRQKSADLRMALANAERMRALTRELGLPFIINDRVDIALAVGADGVHLGPEDIPVPVARRLLGACKIIGASTGTITEALQATQEGADYLGVGAVYATRSKADAGDPIGPHGLREIVQTTHLPIVGIGGITAENVAGVVQAGAAGAAVITAIACAPDMQAAARTIRGKIEAARA